ncbi:hypothetical protein ABZP36_008175 [Zizania latifolia]
MVINAPEGSIAETIRHRVVSQVLELGILVHSVIIGVSLGASVRSSTIRPLVGALSFHQFFEGIGLGGCIVQQQRSNMFDSQFLSQANFKKPITRLTEITARNPLARVCVEDDN